MSVTELAEQIRAVQMAYPQIWFACHRAHRGRTEGDGITDPEAGVLMHLAALPAQTPTRIAKHLGVGRPALSAQLKRLQTLGLIHATPGPDARQRLVRLSEAGATLAAARSPLEANLVGALLQALPTSERDRAVRGLQLLARAAHSLATGVGALT
jgi:DNA-binding MarR family transcriptional regulator